MNKHSLLIKKIKKQILSINSLIESYFNKLKLFKSSFKKGEIIKNNRVFFGLSAVVILTLSYFLIPTFYNKNLIQLEIKNQLSKKYNLEIKFNEKIKYQLLPKPHFSSKNLSIFKNKKEIGISKNFKIFIKIGKFFSINELAMKDLVFKDNIFNLTFNDLAIFKELLKIEPNENQIIFKKSNIFFKSLNDETLFLNKMSSSKFYYDSYNLENILVSKNEIFNVPFKLIIKNDKFNKEVKSKFKSKKIRLDIENDFSYESKVKDGLLDILFVNKSTSLNYLIKENSLNFISKDKKSFKGSMDFKPFFLKVNLNYEGLSTKDLFNEDSIITDLIKSELLNNQNLNVNINLNVNDITNIDELDDLRLNFNLEQGDINFSESKLRWKDDLDIVLSEGLLSYDNNEIYMVGKLVIEVNDIDDFYKSFQIKKIYRKNIKKIALDFMYNFNKNKFQFDNVSIDNSSSENLDKFIDNYNISEKIFTNKITFKNFVSNFFLSYSG